MTLYTESQTNTALWPEPMESTWQFLSSGPPTTLAKRMPHLGLADVLFIGAVANTPRHRRPQGAITWMADVFRISRVSVYTLGKRLQQRLQTAVPVPVLPAPVEEPKGDDTITVTANRVARTILAATFPGSVSIRPTQAILQEAFDQPSSVGSISQLRLRAGRRAGEMLRQVDTTPLGPLVVVRDETFFQGYPILIVIDPVSTTILIAEACTDRQAETWGLALLEAQDGGATITGLIEDMARFYPKSQKLVDMGDLAVQKDPWHVLRDGGKVRLYLEKAACRAMHKVLKLEKQLDKAWDDALFEDQYLPALAQEAQLIAQHDTFAEWLGYLNDALQVVDWRSGEIQDPDTAAWLLQETLDAMAEIVQPRVQSFVKTVRNHQAQLLTCLDWTAAALAPWQQALAELYSDPDHQRRFQRIVARHWRLQQASRKNHRRWQAQATQARRDFLDLIDDDPDRMRLATHLMRLLDGAGHTSSLVECINSLLKPFLRTRKGFRNLHTLQAYLNLFTLWHNMRIYQRGKRKGQSPYQMAGIDPGADDWLELLGYPAN